MGYKLINAGDVSSVCSYNDMPSELAKATEKTRKRGFYSLAAKDICLINNETKEIVKLGDAKPIPTSEFIGNSGGYAFDKERLNGTFAGLVYKYFWNKRIAPDRKNWSVMYKED